MVRNVGFARVVNRALEEDNGALKFPRSAGVFAKMAREDAQVYSVLQAIMLPIIRASWWLDPNGADEEVTALVAGDLRMQVLGDDPKKPLGRRSGRVSWDLHLRQALRSFQFGHMFFEQVYEVGVDGRNHLRKLAPRWPGTISEIKVADDGGLESITQSGGGVDGRRVIPVQNLVAYVHDDVGGMWHGQSVLRPAYKHWKLRDDLLRLELDVLDRNGMGVPWYRGSDLTNDPEEDLRRGQELAESFRSGASAGAATPAGSQLSLLGVSGQLVSPREAIVHHESMIAKAVLAHFMNLENGGSYNLAEVQSSFFVQSLQTRAEQIADVATQHIVEDLVRVAFPDYEGVCPRIVCDPIASKKELSAQDLSTLKRDGVLLADPELEEHVRRVYSLPPKQKLKDALAGKKARLEMEEEYGVTLSPDAAQPAGSVDSVIASSVAERAEAFLKEQAAKSQRRQT